MYEIIIIITIIILPWGIILFLSTLWQFLNPEGRQQKM